MAGLTVAFRGFVDILKSFFVYKIQISIFALFAYSALIIYVLYLINFWKFFLLKDSIFWFITSAMTLFFNISKAHDSYYFKEILRNNLKIILLIEFITNFYTFSLVTELILVPTISLAFLLQTFAEYTSKKNPEHLKAASCLKKVLNYYSISILVYVVFKTIVYYRDLFTINNLKSFLLPVISTLLVLPYFYFLALIMNYETLFISVRFITKDEKIKKRLKRAILLKANFNLDKLNDISKNLKKIDIHNLDITEYVESLTK